MVRFRDFTNLPVGTEIFGAVIRDCPKCHKRGLLEITSGKAFYVHSETVGIREDGSPDFGWKQCGPLEFPAEDQ